MISDIVRYHKIRYIKILYPYPEFLELISRYRIPSKYSSIPNIFFCPLLGAPSLVHQDTLYVRTQLAGKRFSFSFFVQHINSPAPPSTSTTGR